MEPRVEKLLDQLRYHRELYYNDIEPEEGREAISDEAYDAIEQELQGLAEDDSNIAEALAEVGRPPGASFAEVKHDPPMLSLDKVFNEDDLSSWLDKQGGEEMLLWPKFDGVSLSIVYQNGQLIRAATRGDGQSGEDITANIGCVANIPTRLTSDFSGEVRGEVVMHKDDFADYNKRAEENGLRIFANPRNAVSGSLRLKNPARDRHMNFYPFDLIGFDGPVVEGLEELGFVTSDHGEGSQLIEIVDYINQTENERNQRPYELDGVVIRIKDEAAYQKAGATSHHPRGAIAYKMAAEIVETKLLEIEWQVGKTGLVAPRGRMEPVWVAGAMVEYASLHNLAVIAERDIRLGDLVQLRRSGEVIPQVLGPVDIKKRKGNEVVIEAPADCPSCGGELREEGDSRLLYCDNRQCSQQIQRRLEHWVSRPAADIDALGEKLLAKLMDHDVIESIADIYRLDRETLMPDGTPLFTGLGDKSVARLLDSIANSKDLGLRRALIGLSIPLASEGTAKRLCRAGFETIEDIAAASEDELSQIEDIGPMVAQSIHNSLNHEDLLHEVQQLRHLGINLSVKDEDRPKDQAGALSGKRIVISGTLSVSRSQFAQLLEEAGAEVSGSVSKKTDILVCGENAGSKEEKARNLGVTILNEAEARKLIS